VKVLLLANHLRPGGIATYIVNLGQGLERKGVEVIVASRGGEETKRIKTHFFIPLKTKFIFSPRLLMSYLQLQSLVQEKKIDLVHANTRITQFLAFLLNKSTGIKRVCGFHGFYRPHFFRRLIKLGGDLNIAVSEEVKRHLVADLGFNPASIRVVPSGIDIERWARKEDKALAQKRLGLEGYPLVGIVARLAPEKQHLLLIEAFSLLLSAYPGAKLVIAGRGREEEKIRREIKKRSLKDKVYILSDISAEDVLESLDIFVLPSLKEGFGLSVLEAQAKGVAVVCSCVGGLKDIVRQRENGVFFYENHPQALKDAILELLQNKDFCEKIKAKAKVILKERFSHLKMAELTLSVYNEILAKQEES